MTSYTNEFINHVRQNKKHRGPWDFMVNSHFEEWFLRDIWDKLDFKAITNESVTDALGKLVQEIDTGNTNEDLELNFKFKGTQFEVGHEFY